MVLCPCGVVVRRARGRYPQATRILNEALQLAEQACGSDSLEAAGILNELGILAKCLGRFEEGRAHYERALAILLARVGPDAPDVAFFATQGSGEDLCRIER